MLGFSQADKDDALIQAIGRPFVRVKTDEARKAIRRGANPDARNHHEPLIFQAADKDSDEEAVKALVILIEAKANLASRAQDGMTVLHRLAYKGHVNALRTCFLAGMDIHQENSKGQPPLYEAIKWCYPNQDALKFLMGRGALDNPFFTTKAEGLCAAVKHDIPQSYMKSLLDVLEDINARDGNGKTPLHWAGQCNDETGAVELLLTRTEIDIEATDKDGVTPAGAAAKNGKFGVLMKLAEAGARLDVKVGGKSLVYHALKNENPEMAQYIFKKYPEAPDAAELTELLVLACEKDYVGLIPLFAKAGANVNACDSSGNRVLITAASNNKSEIVQALIEAGANLELTNYIGRTAEEVAASSNAQKSLNMLAAARHENERKNAKNKVKAAEAVEDSRFKKLGPHVLEVREEGNLSMVFNFHTQQVFYRDTHKARHFAVMNFNDVQRQEAIREAYEQLKKQGGTPPELGAAALDKPKPGLS